KRSEVLQMLVLKPRFTILDEPDSGLDIDAVKAVAGSINKLVSPETSAIVITHYARILRYIEKLDYVHVMSNGRIAKSGGRELAEKLEEKGYSWVEAGEEKEEGKA
ncbi:MAG: ABC transporter ATP-binding protein, partial [Nitrososphaerales archaeon]